MTLQELTEQAISLPTAERLALIKSVEQSLQNSSADDARQFLWVYPHTWRKQLYMKGRKLPASIVWSDVLTNEMTVAETADNWDLSTEAVHEAIRYCETHRELIRRESKRDRDAAKRASTVSRHVS